MRTLRAAASIAAGAWATVGAAQSPLMQPGFVAGGPAAAQDVVAADYRAAGGGSPFVNAYGEPFVMPAQYCGPCEGGGYGGGMPGGAAGDPFGGAYQNTEQCGPHYFDISAEYLRYWRDEAALSNLPISTAGFVNELQSGALDPGSLAAGTRLSGDSVSSDALDGFRLTGRLDVGALSVVEVSYSGLFSEDSASVTVPNTETTARLFSVFSRYGTRTNGGAGSQPGRPLGANFAETDFASRHEITYESDLQTAEALFRRYWVGFNPRVSGTILLGFRYTSLSEALGFNSIGSQQLTTNPDTFGPNPALSIAVNADADNHLAGFECGGDAWVTLLQGFRVGSEVKVGIYNNDYEVSSRSVAADGSPSAGAVSLVSGDQVAFLTELRATAVADLTSSLSLRVGYELLFISDVALVGDSLSIAAPYGDVNGIAATLPSAAPSANDDILFHGLSVGAEFVW